jgi:hypothetical protein
VVTAPRLFSRWWVAGVLLLLFLCIGVGVVAVVAADGLAQVTYSGIGLSGLVLLVAAVRSIVLPRHRGEVRSTPDGTTVFESPALIVWPVVLAGVLMYSAAVGLGLLLVFDRDEVESPAGAAAAVIGAVMGTPLIVRLLTGRLRRWRLLLGSDGFTYRGYRTDETVPWSKVHGARIQRGKDASVVIDRKGTGPDRLIPLLPFDVVPEQVVEQIEARLRSAHRR